MLSEYFIEDFATYSASSFSNISTNSCHELHDGLGFQGVNNDRNVLTSEALAAVVKEDVLWWKDKDEAP